MSAVGEPVAIRVLLVDDDGLTRDLVTRVLTSEKFEVAVASSAEQIEAVTRAFQPDAVLVDVHIPDMPGGGAVALVRSAAPPGARIVLFSADDEEALRATVGRVQADGWLSKNKPIGGLGEWIRKLVGP